MKLEIYLKSLPAINLKRWLRSQSDQDNGVKMELKDLLNCKESFSSSGKKPCLQLLGMPEKQESEGLQF